ncbi:MAG: type II and III secretion system protein [bacterium]|nr:type II and III secretion system protein [bacterium]
MFFIIICQFGLYSTGGAQVPTATSLESRRTELIARSLLDEHRYQEAESYLKLQLKILPAGTNRLPLLLLLADSQVGLDDLVAAKATLAEAERVAVKPSGQGSVFKRQQKISRMETGRSPPRPDSLTVPPSLLKAAVNSPGASTLITNSFFETDLRQVLTDLSMAAGIPILWDATVQGLVTYEAKDQPLDNVLNAILLPAGYTYSFKDNAYYVGSARPEDPAFGLLSKTAVVTLANLQASEAIGLLSDYFKPYVKASPSANMVCITAPPTWIERIKSDLLTIDAPPDQIMIEVIVTEIAKDALREIGLDWTISGTKQNPLWNLTTDSLNVTSPALLYNYTEGAVKLGDQTFNLAASLEALESSGRAKIRANPRITTMNGRKAEITLTRDQYFVIQTGTSQAYQMNTLQAVSSGIKLEITPYTAPSGEITVYVKPQVGDVVGKGANDLPEISNRTANTAVRVMDGQTFTIGGLSLQSEKNTQKKIPFLGDIPILGYLFRYERVEKSDTEIVIFITPHILKG